MFAVVTIDDVMKVIPDPYYGPAFHDQPILAHEKVRFVGEPVAAVLAADPHVAEEAAQLIVAEYEELPAVYDEVDALTSKTYVHDVLQAGRHLRRPQAPQGRQGHQHRARLPAAPRRRRQGVRARRARVRARVQDAEGAAPSVRAARVDRRLQGHRRHRLHRLAGPVVRAHRDRAAARLAGEQGAHQGAVSRLAATAPSSTSSSKRWWSRCR